MMSGPGKLDFVRSYGAKIFMSSVSLFAFLYIARSCGAPQYLFVNLIFHV